MQSSLVEPNNSWQKGLNFSSLGLILVQKARPSFGAFALFTSSLESGSSLGSDPPLERANKN